MMKPGSSRASDGLVVLLGTKGDVYVTRSEHIEGQEFARTIFRETGASLVSLQAGMLSTSRVI